MGRVVRRASRVVGIVASALVVGGPAGATGESPTRGLPDHIWAYTMEYDGSTSTSHLMGHAVASYLVGISTTEADEVLVAPDGRYARFPLAGRHDLAESDFSELESPDVEPELSPDGTRLAWNYQDARVHGSGITILDLATGAQHDVALPGTQGTSVARMAWSPNGRWLSWTGQDITRWSRDGIAFGDNAGGVISTGTIPHAVRLHVTAPTWDDIGVCDDGSLVQEGQDSPARWRRGWSYLDPIRITDLRRCSTTGQISSGTRATLFLLGRLPGGEAVTLRSSESGSAGDTVDIDGRPVTVVEPGATAYLSVATGLIDADRPSNHVTRPAWPTRSSHRGWWIGGGVGAALLALAGMGLARRQRAAR